MTAPPALPAGSYTGAAWLIVGLITMMVIVVIWLMIAGLADLIEGEDRNHEGKNSYTRDRDSVGHSRAVHHRKNGERGK